MLCVLSHQSSDNRCGDLGRFGNQLRYRQRSEATSSEGLRLWLGSSLTGKRLSY